MNASVPITLVLSGPEETDRLARWFAPRLGPGDAILLEGQIGAGKTHFARALIRARLAEKGVDEHVPSPTFTLVQLYQAGSVGIVHADLYRLSSPDEVHELGLSDAFAKAITLVEWPDRLGADMPADRLALTFRDSDGGRARTVTVTATSDRWADTIAALRREWAHP